MNSYQHNQKKGFFELAKESASISFDSVIEKYYQTQTSVIIENVG